MTGASKKLGALYHAQHAIAFGRRRLRQLSVVADLQLY